MPKEMDAAALPFSPSFSFSCSLGKLPSPPVGGVVSPTLRVSLPSSVKALCKYSHRHNWRLKSYMIPNEVKLTVGISIVTVYITM